MPRPTRTKKKRQSKKGNLKSKQSKNGPRPHLQLLGLRVDERTHRCLVQHRVKLRAAVAAGHRGWVGGQNRCNHIKHAPVPPKPTNTKPTQPPTNATQTNQRQTNPNQPTNQPNPTTNQPTSNQPTHPRLTRSGLREAEEAFSRRRRRIQHVLCAIALVSQITNHLEPACVLAEGRHGQRHFQDLDLSRRVAPKLVKQWLHCPVL